MSGTKIILPPIIPNYLGESAINPVGAFNGGETYYNTVLHEEMFYDASRSKWLSIATLTIGFGRNGTTSAGAMLKTAGNVRMVKDIRGLLTKGKLTLVDWEASRVDVDAAKLIMYEGLVSIANLDFGVTNAIVTTQNVDIAANKILSIEVDGGFNAITNCSGTYALKLRI